MGAVGTSNKAESYYDFKDNPILSDENTNSYSTVKWWQEHTELSNYADWENQLTASEVSALDDWAGAGYHYGSMGDLYTTEWDDLSPHQKQMAIDMFNGLNKFELKKGITVNRATDFQILGADPNQKLTAEQVVSYLNNETKDGMIQSDGFMSFTTMPNGYSVAGKGLVIHLNVPPSKGAGAYIGNVNHYEREFLLNNNSVLKFDKNSVREENGRVHINAKLVGRSNMQTIDSKNKTQFKKEIKPKF